MTSSGESNRLGFHWALWLVPDRSNSRRYSSGDLQWYCGLRSSLAWRRNRNCRIPDPSCRLVWSNARSSRGPGIANHKKRPDELLLDRVWRDHRNSRIMAVHSFQVAHYSSHPVRMVLVAQHVRLEILL